jgi:hypothetical protein
MNWKQARRTENNVDRSTVMLTKTSGAVEQSLKEKNQLGTTLMVSK